MKKIFAAAAVALALTASAGAAFEKNNTYTPELFTDIPVTEWYASEVAGAYELGLMNGIGSNLFAPNGNVTVAEAITLASRAHALYLNEAIPDASGEWYAKYVSYAKTAGIIADEFTAADFDRPATRSEVAELFRKAMPADWFAAVNSVSTIPDVPENASYRDGLLLLYNAGIVMGSDSFGTFNPDANIIRAEAAAIINRVALPEKRLHKTLDKVSYSDAYLLAQSTTMSGSKEGIASGWLLDNRGGTPRKTLAEEGYSSLFDKDTEAGTAYIREFNKFSTGKVTLDTAFSAKGEGVYLEYRNDSGDAVYRAEIKDNAWQLLNADGSYTKLCDLGDTVNFTFYVTVDLDNLRSNTIINKKDCGTYPLSVSADKANILNFRFATTEKSTGMLTPGKTEMFVNYAVYDNFDYDEQDALPFDWTGDAVAKDYALLLEKGTAGKYFGAVSGTVVAEFEMLLPKNENVTYTLTHDGEAVAAFEAKDGVLTVNGTTVYTDAVANLWYRLRFELDTSNKTMLVKVNGRKAETVPFASKASSVSALSFENKSETEIYLDKVRVYRTFEHADYVPVPVKPAGEGKYTVGLNVCPLWQNGKHIGWSCITPFDDIKPVLGYYDEGRPETADWEIKYLVEHGVDFQAFCVFFTKKNGSVCLDNDGYPHLYEGFMNAKYADMTKFCAILEAANAASASSLEEWKKDYVPYILENLIKDDRYMVIDNKPLIMVFGSGTIKNRAGGVEQARAMFDYLEEEVKKLGYDGVLFLGSVGPGSNVGEYAALGYDGNFAYNWGTNGYKLDENKKWNLNYADNAESTGVYNIPTVSVGFNNVGWAGVRYPMAGMNDFKSALTWVRDEYLPKYAKESWQKNFMMLSTWNEYGEGTFMMPTTDEKGFGYLDAVREVFTDEKANASVNTVPTDAQKERINHLYPQYRRLLRREGYDVALDTESDPLIAAASVDFAAAKASDYNTGNIRDGVIGADGFTGISSNNDPMITLSTIGELNLDTRDIIAIRLTAKMPKDSVVQLFFRTSEAGNLSEDKSFILKATSDETETFLIDPAKKATWKGTLTGMRLDPCATEDTTFTVTSIELLQRDAINSVIGTKGIEINGFKKELPFAAEKTADGDRLVPFDPTIGLDFALGAFHEWDKDKGVLTLHFKKHTVVFTVGSDSYTVDGASKKLSQPIKATDGLPMIPMKTLCDILGYTYSVNEAGDVVLVTPDKAYFDEIEKSRVEGSWEFNVSGDSEGWTSGDMSLLADDGYLSCESASAHSDPTLKQKNAVNLVAGKYNKFEVRVRYSYTSEKLQTLTMYFSTDKSPGMNENKAIHVRLKTKDTGGEWETYTVDLATCKEWKNTITALRFDPFNAYGHMDIDYIRFIENPDYDEASAEKEREAELAAEKEKHKELFGIINGDAEGSEIGFVKDNGTLEIVEDPTNPDNHCYLALPNTDKEKWLYTVHKMHYTPGATYTVSADVMLAAHGTDVNPPSELSATVLANARYADTVYDHVVGRCEGVVAGAWKHWTFTFTVAEDSAGRNGDYFCFYSDPIDGKGIGYYFDNVVITEQMPED